MAAFAGLMNRQMTTAQALTGPAADPAAAPLDSSGDSGSSSATISSNDFLTLLVTEMQNQDPTADTDPNEYISQLVQVNSLEQLISINQNLTTALGSSGTSSTTGSSVGFTPGSPSATNGPAAAPPAAGITGKSAAVHGAGATPVQRAGGSARTAAAINQFVQSSGAQRAPGNLSNPESKPAARRVAHALDGQASKGTSPARMRGLK